METLTIRNWEDIVRAGRGEIAREGIRTLRVEALVDTGASFVGLHRKDIEYLGLNPVEEQIIQTGGGTIVGTKYDGARLELLGRQGVTDIFAVDDAIPPIIGFLLLETLNLIVDPVEQRVRVHPNNGGRETHWLLHARSSRGPLRK